MVSFAMVVGHELDDRATKMSLPQQNYAIEALLLDRPNEPFRVGIGVSSQMHRSGRSAANVSGDASVPSAARPCFPINRMPANLG